MANLISRIRKAVDHADIHVDMPLSILSVAYLQATTDFVGAQWFPVVPVLHKSDLYYSFPKRSFFRNRSQAWTPGTQMPQARFDTSKETYSCDIRAFEFADRWDLRTDADPQLSWDQAVAEFVTRVMMLGREIDIATTYFKTGIWATEYTGGTNFPASGTAKWSNYSASKPIEDVRIARLAMKKATGFGANTMVVSEDVFETLADHPDLKELYKYTQVGILSVELVARALRIPRLLVGGAIQVTSVEGAGTETYDWIFGGHAWIGYVAPNPARLTPSAGYIFSWRNFTGGFDIVNERHVDNRAHVDFVQGLMAYDPKLVASDLGVFFLNAI